MSLVHVSVCFQPKSIELIFYLDTRYLGILLVHRTACKRDW